MKLAIVEIPPAVARAVEYASPVPQAAGPAAHTSSIKQAHFLLCDKDV